MNAKCKVQIEKGEIRIGHFDLCILQSSFCNEFLDAGGTPSSLASFTTFLPFLSFDFDVERADHILGQEIRVLFKRHSL
jgi:hypothetical protein